MLKKMSSKLLVVTFALQIFVLSSCNVVEKKANKSNTNLLKPKSSESSDFSEQNNVSTPIFSSSGSSVQLSTNCNQSHDLPLVTHWSNTEGVKLGASDQISISNPDLGRVLNDPNAIKYIYNYNFLPIVNNYIGTNYSLTAYPNEIVRSWVKRICQNFGQAFKIWRPDSFLGNNAIHSIKNRAPKKSGVVLVISGLTISQSMFTIFLPANWDLGPARYPIIFNGFYDLNTNLINEEGKHMAGFIARSVQNKGSGAIGVLWNGAGAIASRTVNREAWNEFQKVIDLVASLGGDKDRIIGFGGSRGGITSLQIASNPYSHHYKFRYIDSAVPAGHLGTIAEVASPTVSSLMTAVEWSVGLADAHKKSFRYPQVGNGLAGLNSFESHLAVLTGISNPRIVDSQYSLGSNQYINALKNAGTQVFLDIASHDYIVPSFDQLWLYRQYKEKGIPIELKYNYLNGHNTSVELRNQRVEKQMKVYTHKTGGLHPLVKNGRKEFYKVNPQTKKLEKIHISDFLYTLEVPRYLSPEVEGLIIQTGIPGTAIKMTIRNPAGGIEIHDRTLNSYGYDLFKFDPKSISIGTYTFEKIQIKKPGSGQWKNISMNKRTYKMSSPNEPLITDNLEKHPEGKTGGDIHELIIAGYLGANKEKAHGHFNGVTYGLVE